MERYLIGPRCTLIVSGATGGRFGTQSDDVSSTSPEFTLGLLALLGTVAVLLTQNASDGWKRFAKFLVSASAAIVTAAVSAFFTHDFSSAPWTTLLAGLLTSVLVYLATSGESPPASSAGRPRS